MENRSQELNEFLQQINIDLNAQQRAAALRTEGATLLLAVPGSGKTTVMICRLGFMIKVLKIPQEQILTITFSKTGARDLEKRYRRLIERDGEIPHFSTIHSFAYYVIRCYSHRTGRKIFEVLEDASGILKDLYLKLFKSFPGDNEIEDIKNHISMAKNLMLSLDEIRSADFGDIDFPRIYESYEMVKKTHHLMDYDDMLGYALGLLKREKALFDFFAGRYRYICLDEAQDTSKLQFALIDLLARPRGNLFMVGDEDQSIYGFRGAYPQSLLRFKSNWPDGKVLLMETNYRSSAALVAAADRFIHLNPDRFEKNMTTPNPKGVSAVWEKVSQREDQYTFLLNAIRKEGKETAILYRNNESAIPLVDLFETDHLPYQLKEHHPGFFSHFILKDIRNFYALTADSSNLEVFRSIYYKMNCFISKSHLEAVEGALRSGSSIMKTIAGLREIPRWQKDCLLDACDIFDLLDHIPVYRGLRLILDDLGYRDHLEYRIEHGYPREKIEQKLAILKILAKRYPEKEVFWQRLRDLEMILNNTAHSQQGIRGRPLVTLSTIHSAKGLEWDKVFMIDCVDGEFPSHAALAETEAGKKLLAEEIRLFYVGVTRAKKELEFITVRKAKKIGRTLPVSRFITTYFDKKQPCEKADDR